MRSKAIIVGQQTGRPVRQRNRRGPIITIDGPAGVGKSTIAKQLASRLGYQYLDTGALYRAVAWKVQASGVDPTDHQTVSKLLSETRIALEQSSDGVRVLVDDRDVTREIRTPEISEVASVVSAIPAVRQWLLPVQRQVSMSVGMVAEGRDLGTHVFPEADVKFFLEADVDIRAARRRDQLRAAGQITSLAQTQEDIKVRDLRDRSRVVAPLVPAADARLINTSILGVDAIVEQMMAVIASKL
ncbi:MAG TPA: (d)CMP kinase [Nitrospiraceae bacterium]|nr:(d)CMP kinase [Nitrospiraceae bacterium]